MAQAREKGGRVVFIGNIPYGVSEEQICDLFGRVGTVVHFRLVYDKETHRPKGFGFLEYTNVDDAASAVRNLNDHELMGRKIKVDYSNDNGGGGATTTTNTTAHPNGTGAAALPRLPEGAPLPPGVTASDAISMTLSQIPPPVLLDVLSHMKNLVSTNPAQATALLTTAPQLSYAIFQAMLILGLIDPAILSSLIPQTQPQQQQQPPPPPVQYLPPQPQYQQTPAQYPPQPTYAPPQQSYGTPPVTHNPYQPPPPAIDGQQQAIINQVLNMSRSDWIKLPVDQREMINTFRQQHNHPPLV